MHEDIEAADPEYHKNLRWASDLGVQGSCEGPGVLRGSRGPVGVQGDLRGSAGVQGTCGRVQGLCQAWTVV